MKTIKFNLFFSVFLLTAGTFGIAGEIIDADLMIFFPIISYIGGIALIFLTIKRIEERIS